MSWTEILGFVTGAVTHIDALIEPRPAHAR
jgi:hypothetical protein